MILIILPIVIGCVVVLGGNFLRWYLHVNRTPAALLSVLLPLVAFGVAAYRTQSDRWLDGVFYGTLLLIPAGVVLLLKLYRTWTRIDCTDEERLPGSAGVRTWLSPMNLALAGLIAVSAHYAFKWPLLGLGAFVAVLLLALPAINTLLQMEGEETDLPPSEQANVLGLLNAGKISAAESVELLNALSSSDRRSRKSSTPSGNRRLMLVGTALVLIGFFLPWFTVNPSEELSRLAKSAGPFGALFINAPRDLSSVNVAGGDLGQGLGWIVLLSSRTIIAISTAASS